MIDGRDGEICDRFLSRGICDRLLEKEFVIDGIDGEICDRFLSRGICDRWDR